jgi:hypothetical protein
VNLKNKALTVIFCIGVQIWTPISSVRAESSSIKTACWSAGAMLSAAGTIVAYLKCIEYQQQLSNRFLFPTERCNLQNKINLCYNIIGALGTATLLSTGLATWHFCDYLCDTKNDEKRPFSQDKKKNLIPVKTIQDDLLKKLTPNEKVEVIPDKLWAILETKKLLTEERMIEDENGKLLFLSEEKIIKFTNAKGKLITQMDYDFDFKQKLKNKSLETFLKNNFKQLFVK